MAEALAPAALAPAGRVLDDAAVVRAPGEAALEGPASKALAGGGPPAPPCTVVPDPSRFDASWFEPLKVSADGTIALPLFRELLLEHNQRLPDIALLHQAVLDTAQGELSGASPTNLLQTIGGLYDDAFGVSSPLTLQDFADRLVATVGHPAVYDPWDGWWAGLFNANGYKRFNLHIWEPSVAVTVAGYAQYVQAVTQVEVDGPGDWWFASARRMLEEPLRSLTATHAVNVWSERDGLVTGYVRKTARETRNPTLPHVGFLIEPTALLWLAVLEKRDTPVGAAGRTLMMFLEPTFKGVGPFDRYVIRGARGSAKRVGGTTLTSADGRTIESGGRIELGSFVETNLYLGEYFEAMHLQDRASLRCAIDTGALVRMSKSFAEKLHKATAP